MVGSYRFDDPEGEVGVEALIVRRGSSLLQVPMTYRGAALDGGEEHLVGTMHHSVLGQRWIYEAAGDPVAVACFDRALSGQQEQETLELYDGGELVERREPSVRIQRRVDTTASAGGLRLATALDDELRGHEMLVATWTAGKPWWPPAELAQPEAHLMQVRAVGRASSRPSGIRPPHRSQVP